MLSNEISTSILVTEQNLHVEDLIKSKNFKNLETNHVNLGFDSKQVIWLKINIKNLLNQKMEKIVVIDNPLLEKVFFFDNGLVHKSGMLYVSSNRKEIFPSYSLTLHKKEVKTIFVQIQNKTTTLQFGIEVLNKQAFEKRDKIKQFSIVLFIGLLSAFIFYSLFLFIYTKDSSYYLYSFYLLTLMFQQLTYIGFLPLYAPSWFVYIDNLIVVPKVSLMIVAAALFAKNFLKMRQFVLLDKIYKIFIVVIIIQIPIFGTQYFYVPEITVIIGFLFIIFNTYSAIYVYRQGNRQARFFLVGWVFLFIGYILMIFDALGLISIMNMFPELILWITVIEAIFLMLAFVDKLNILTSQKNELDKKLFEEMNSRQIIIENEVVQRTSDLKIALEEKVVLFREVHHRVKNNLQLILSIIRLQKFDLKNHQNYEEFEKLENRIKAISKTHELLCGSDDIVEINMKDYIQELYNELSESFIDKNIKLDLNVDVTMFLSQAVYVGLIINELISNSIKHAFDKNMGKIYIYLHKKEKEYTLCVGDSGKGYDKSRVREGSLGLKLVNSLAIHQLEGTIYIEKSDFFKCVIKFHI